MSETGLRSLLPLLLLLLPTCTLALSHVPLGAAGAKTAECTAAVRLAHPVGRPDSEAPKGWAAARRRRSSDTRCGLLSALKVDDNSGPSLAEGQQVRVKEKVTFMHVPGNKQGFDAQGAVGTVLKVYDEKNLSPNREVKVTFTEPKKWVGHFEASELEPL